ncbi:hypothetical protein [Halobacterium zhouii]|uniref:hypothetical protein n=1 Tax=Halobacterium zhouii TaxID=2902624 RepID=UPI001E38A1B0|nr:hypothetical protein [Halobacterium zhouii]
MTMGIPLGAVAGVFSAGYLVLGALAYVVGMVGGWSTTRETGCILAVWSFLPTLAVMGVYVLIPVLPGELSRLLMVILWPVGALATVLSPLILAVIGVAPWNIPLPWHTREDTTEN